MYQSCSDVASRCESLLEANHGGGNRHGSETLNSLIPQPKYGHSYESCYGGPWGYDGVGGLRRVCLQRKLAAGNWKGHSLLTVTTCSHILHAFYVIGMHAARG